MDKETVELFKSVFRTTQGAKVLKQLMEECFYTDSCVDIANPYAMYFAQGKRAIIEEILQLIEINYDELENLRAKEPSLDYFPSED